MLCIPTPEALTRSIAVHTSCGLWEASERQAKRVNTSQYESIRVNTAVTGQVLPEVVHRSTACLGTMFGTVASTYMRGGSRPHAHIVIAIQNTRSAHVTTTARVVLSADHSASQRTLTLILLTAASCTCRGRACSASCTGWPSAQCAAGHPTDRTIHVRTPGTCTRTSS